jgi:Fur family transcriptional regulator, ferric uptake regulator
MVAVSKWRGPGGLGLGTFGADMTSNASVGSGRSTRQKRALAGVIDDAQEFRSAQELHEVLRARGEHVGLTTVYNQLRALAEAGLVDTLRSSDGETLYRRCGSSSHHHHLLCRLCGRTVEVAGAAIERWAEQVAEEAGFVDVSHTIEVVGTCPTCARPA